MLTRSTHGKRTRARSSSRFIAWRRSSSTRSHLFIASTSARPASATWVATRRSCSLIGSEASSSSTVTSAASIAALVRSDWRSTPCPRPGATLRRRPAVSTSCHVSPSISTSESTGSVVVPAVASTTDARLAGELVEQARLADVGLADQRHAPRAALERRASSRGRLGHARRARASSRSPDPRPCRPDTGCGSPSPRRHSAGISRLAALVVDLRRARRITGRSQRRSVRATASSTVVAPTWPSTTSRIDVGGAHRGLGLRGDRAPACPWRPGPSRRCRGG